MHVLSQRFCWMLLLIGFTTSGSVFAQSFFVGPSAWYLITTNAPQGSESQSQPTRYLLGASASWLFGKKAELRTTVGYRSETGSFTTPISQAPSQHLHPTGGSLDVVDNPATEPNLLSTISASSVELTAALCLPLMALDTTGAAIGISVGGLADVMMQASQDDDYSSVPGHQGPTVVTANYNQQIGYGALLGAYLNLPLGTSRLVFDAQYVFREPGTLTTNTTPPIEQQTSWLIGQGVRVGLTLLFGM